MYQHAAEFFGEHGEHGTADREARDAETGPREPAAGMTSHHPIRRSVPRVQPVRRSPYSQVTVHRVSDANSMVR
jgi:hypothetical protein